MMSKNVGLTIPGVEPRGILRQTSKKRGAYGTALFQNIISLSLPFVPAWSSLWLVLAHAVLLRG